MDVHGSFRRNHSRMQRKRNGRIFVVSQMRFVLVDEPQSRMKKRLEEIERERKAAPMPPVVVGGAIVIPSRLLHQIMELHLRRMTSVYRGKRAS